MNTYSVNTATEQNANRLYNILGRRYNFQDVTIYVDGSPKSVTFLSGYGAYVCNGVTTSEDEWLAESADPDLADAIRTQEYVWAEYHAGN